MSVQNQNVTNTITRFKKRIVSDWERHDVNLAPERFGLLKPPESNSLVFGFTKAL